MKWPLFLLVSVSILASGACVAGATADVQTLSISAHQLQAAFNGQADRARLILVFSPT